MAGETMLITFLSFWACTTDPSQSTIDDDSFIVPAGYTSENAYPIPGDIDGYNLPTELNPDYVQKFYELPLEGTLSKEPWSGYYWAKEKGGVSYRWQTHEMHNYELLEKDAILTADAATIAKLSPAEKYDILVGNYDFSFTHRIIAENDANEAGWTGICHGWSPASDAYEEPQSVFMTNPDGVTVAFGSSDVKALLSYYRAEVVRSPYPQHEWATTNRTLGTNCMNGNPAFAMCYDTNPGAFHVVLSNQIGMMNEGMNIDADPTYQRWNQPVYAYDSEILLERAASPSASESAVREVVVRTELEYTLEIEPQWVPALGTSEQTTKVVTYLYTVELNSAGEVVGGQWLIDNNNRFVTLEEAYNYLIELDRNGDGRPDHSEDEVASIIWSHFNFPDYIWLQDDVGFPEEYIPLSSMYDIVATTATSRQKLYDYFGMLGPLYEASLER